MIKKTIGIKVLIFPLSVGFLIVFAILFIRPAFSDMMAARKSAKDGSQQLADLESRNAKLVAFKAKWESMEEKKIIEGALPGDQGVDDYMSELYSRVSRSGMLLNNFATQDSSYNSPYVCSVGVGTAAGGAAQSASGISPAVASPPSAVLSGTAPSAPALCANALDVTMSLNGTWEQLLSFLKYLGDTNRIANVKSVVVASGVGGQQGESNPDLLKVDLLVQVFYKPKSEASNLGTISSLTSGEGFDESVLEKIKGIVFTAYEEPSVSETGERNIFK
jgi:Tfp pilus assembly protein PilO